MAYTCPYIKKACPILKAVMLSHKRNRRAQKLAVNCLRCQACKFKIRHDYQNLSGTKLGKIERQLLTEGGEEGYIVITTDEFTNSQNASRRRAANKLESCGLIVRKGFMQDSVWRRSHDVTNTRKRRMGNNIFGRKVVGKFVREGHVVRIKRQVMELTKLGRYVYETYHLTGKRSIRWDRPYRKRDLDYWDENQMIAAWRSLRQEYLKQLKVALRNAEVTSCDLESLEQLREDVSLLSEIPITYS